jgi:hypothetical protein
MVFDFVSLVDPQIPNKADRTAKLRSQQEVSLRLLGVVQPD